MAIVLVVVVVMSLLLFVIGRRAFARFADKELTRRRSPVFVLAVSLVVLFVCVMVAGLFARATNTRADQVKRGLPVERVRIASIELLSVRADLAKVKPIDLNARPSSALEELRGHDKLLYLGRTGGILVLYDADSQSSWHVPAAKPLIGALLRVCWQAVRAQITRDLSAAGFGDIGAAHLAVFQYPSPRGMRVTTLAARAGMSRQAITYLIGELEEKGYLERRPDPTDRRASLVQLTERGEAAVRAIRASIVDLERNWEEEIGRRRFQQLRGTLRALVDSLGDPES